MLKIISSWKVILCLGIAIFFGLLFYQKNIISPDIHIYKFIDIYDSDSWDLKTIKRDGELEFLFIDNIKSPYVINIKIPQFNYNGRLSLWIYTSQADNHGSLTFLDKGRAVGVVDNQVPNQKSWPAQKLSAVGKIEYKNEPLVLNIVGAAKNLDQHYGELGLVILAPENISAAQINEAINKKKQSPFSEISIFLLISLLAVLIYKKLDGIRFLILYAGLVGCLLVVTQQDKILPAINNGSAQRIGLEKITADSTRGAISFLEGIGSEILPSRQVNDIVPTGLEVNGGVLTTEIFYKNQPVASSYLSSKIFSGVLSKVQNLSTDELVGMAYLYFSTLLLLFILNLAIRNKFPTYLFLIITSLGSIFLSIRLSQGWDEFFINLRHAYMLINHGIYSINEYSKIEGTVDFIPLIITAFLGKCGFNLIDSFIAVSLLGNVAVIMFTYLIINNITKSRNWGIAGALLIGLYPNTLWVGASGFMAVLFTSMILASLYFLVFVHKLRLGLLLLGLLTLFRIEGVLLSLLFFAHLIYKDFSADRFRKLGLKKIFKDYSVNLLFLLGPFLASCMLRKLYFGHYMPIPIYFKNTNFDFYYYKAGLFKFSQLILTHDLNIILLINILLYFYNLRSFNIYYKNKIILLGKINVFILIFTIPYYLGGGDWFPDYWNRYGMPFVIVTVISFICLVYGLFISEKILVKKRVSAISFVFLTLGCGFFYSAQNRSDNYLTVTIKSILNQNPLSWERVDRFAALGEFLGGIAPSDAVIASPEEATIMYHSKRDMVGFLGVSNPIIASMPIQPMEPGDILHRKRGLNALRESKPDILLLYEPVLMSNFGNKSPALAEVRKRLEAQVFDIQMATIAYYRVGSYDYLKKMGYQHMTICTNDRMVSLFVNKKIYPFVFESLSANGYEYLGEESVDYKYNPLVTSKYLPSPTGVN